MIEIISGTDRPGSNSLKIANYIADLYRASGSPVGVLDLADLQLPDVNGGTYFRGAQGTFKVAVDRVTEAEGVVVVVPEYNGSYPGILKLFIDYWRYPETFENRPLAFVGLGGRWGGLRPVEHLQQVFGYRNAFMFPGRVFLHNIKDIFQEGHITDKVTSQLLDQQTRDFLKFIRALQSEKLDANSVRAAKKQTP